MAFNCVRWTRKASRASSSASGCAHCVQTGSHGAHLVSGVPGDVAELVRIEIGLDETFDAEEGRSDSACLVRTQDDRAVRESIHTGQPKAASAVSRQQRTRIHLIAGWCSVPSAQVPFCEERQL